MSFNLVKTS